MHYDILTPSGYSPFLAGQSSCNCPSVKAVFGKVEQEREYLRILTRSTMAFYKDRVPTSLFYFMCKRNQVRFISLPGVKA